MEKQSLTNFRLAPQLLYDPADAIRKAGSYADFAAEVVSSLEPGIIQKISGDIGLSFARRQEREGEVCFIHSEEVRPEFKLSFTAEDLADYIFAVFHQNYTNQGQTIHDNTSIDIPFPKNADVFWELVKAGEQLRLQI